MNTNSGAVHPSEPRAPRPRTFAPAWLKGKINATRALCAMVIWLDNWRDVFNGHRGRKPLTPLRFRQGFVLHHSPSDVAVGTFLEVFGDRLYRRHLNESDAGVMVDLGANIGMVSLDWASRLPGVVVHAYEPHPDTFATLAANITANQMSERLRIYKEAVSGQPGTLVLGMVSGISVDASAYGESAQFDESASVRVPAVSLDQVVARCASHGPINLVKMDVEGAEADTLEGASPHSLEKVGQFVIEYHDHLSPDARSRCASVLKHAGFRCRVHQLSENHGILYARRD